MVNIAICDDNLDFAQEICNLIEYQATRHNPLQCHIFDNGDALVTAHKQTPFDIIFLDVVMPMLDGIETARMIRKNDKHVKIVFLTSAPEFAVDSYTVKASNYLLKPVNSNALYHCLLELLEEIAQASHMITIKGLYSVHKIPLDHIEYVEAQNKHIIFSLKDGSTIETTEPLRIHEKILTIHDGFYRCHRSYIVNIHHIDTYTLKEIKMHSGCRIPIARSCHKEFETAYFSVTFGKAGEFK